jgi:hypothetical protein
MVAARPPLRDRRRAYANEFLDRPARMPAIDPPKPS